MVSPSSHGISRVPRYFGSCSFLSVFKYATFMLFGVTSHSLLLTDWILNAVLNPESIAALGLASSAFARHYSQNLG